MTRTSTRKAQGLRKGKKGEEFKRKTKGWLKEMEQKGLNMGNRTVQWRDNFK